MARTIGKKDKKTEKPQFAGSNPIGIKEAHSDRMRRMKMLASENPGIVTSYKGKVGGLKREPGIKIDHRGVAKNKRTYEQSIYDNHRYPYIAEVLCREYGFISTQLAEVLGCSPTTIDKWMQIYPDFRVAVRRGREQFDSTRVEQSLLKRALGYEYVEKTVKSVFLIGKKANSDVEVAVPAREVTKTYKMLPPDVKAIMFWLQNRQPDRWKSVAYIQAQMNANKTVTHVNVGVDTKELENMSVAQIKELRNLIEVSKGGVAEDQHEEITDAEIGEVIYSAGQKLLANDQAIEDYDLEEDD